MHHYFKFRIFIGLIGSILFFIFGLVSLIKAINLNNRDAFYCLGVMFIGILGCIICISILKRKK